MIMGNRKKNKSNAYKEANEAFLAEKAKEEGVVVLESGIMYRRLKEGHGTKRPSPSGVVYVNYTGRLIDGTVFDTTEGQPLPALFTIRDLWGSRWPWSGCGRATSSRSISLPNGATVQ